MLTRFLKTFDAAFAVFLLDPLRQLSLFGDTPYSVVRTAAAVRWMALTIFLGVVKLTVYIFDSNPQVFLGDSMSYLVTALIEWIPPDRSFVYGFLIHDLTSRARSLNSLVAFQTFAGIITALLTAVILVRFFRVSFGVASVVATLLAIEPQQLFYERFVLTESIGTALFALFVFVTLEYVRRRRIWTLAALQIVGIVLVMFRVTYVPVVVLTTVLGPLLAGFRSSGSWSAETRKQELLRLGIHLSISLLLFFGMHRAYQRWNGRLSKLPPAYTYADGFFLITNVSTLVTPADSDNPKLRSVLSRPLAYANSPDQISDRNAEMFGDDGIVQRIKNALMDDYAANVECKRIAYKVIFRDPIGFIRLAVRTYLRFYSRAYMTDVLHAEEGMSELEPDQLTILAQYHLDGQGLPFSKTLTRQYHFASWPYYIVLLHTPLFLLACTFVTRAGSRRFMLFLLLATTLHVAAVQVAGVDPSPRHLHSAAVPLAIAVGVLASRTGQERKKL